MSRIKSDFHVYREKYQPALPKYLQGNELRVETKEVKFDQDIAKLFPCISEQIPKQVNMFPAESQEKKMHTPLRVGCVLSGGQAAGGHNVIIGLYDYIKKRSQNSQLFGFLNGPIGIYEGNYVELDQETISFYKNRGGFDMIKSGRNKIETEQQFQKSLKTCQTLKLDGLVVIGGDDSNTNACLLAEYFLKHKCQTQVIGCPKTIDGDLKNEMVEVSFGFDTACKTYSELIGNLMIDTLSTMKYWHFIRLMGRSASHITLECALLTRPTMAFIGEEVEKKKQTLQQIIDEIVQTVIYRQKNNMNYGIILVPEGLIEFIPEMNILIKEINDILATSSDVKDAYQYVYEKLTKDSQKLMEFLPKQISNQLLLDRDPHGNVQVAKIETEKLLIDLVQSELQKLNINKFSSQSHYYGYEGRCAFPSKFDCDYCYNLGVNAAVLVEQGFTGLMSCIRNLTAKVQDWIPCGYPLVAMMNVEVRKSKNVPVIKKALTDLDGNLFKIYEKHRESWKKHDYFRQIGPIQYEFQSKYDVPYLVNAVDEDFQDQSIVNSNTFSHFNQNNVSEFQKALSSQNVILPQMFTENKYKVILSKIVKNKNHQDEIVIQQQLNYLHSQSRQLAEVVVKSNLDQENNLPSKLRIGVCFNSRQSPGGHNVIDGLLKFCQQTDSKLFGFLNGVKGLFDNNNIEITEENFSIYRNTGGYHFLGRYADKIRSQQEKEQTAKTCQDLNLDGLVLIGATHTFTDAAYLANQFIQNNIKTKIITVPCTIDNNIGHHMLEQSVGFDSASKLYSQLVGNIMIDSASAVKYWYFMRLMGRDPSHMVLECALQTRPNITIISEEVASKRWNLQDVVNYIADIVALRSENKMNFGTVLIPEGILAHLPNFITLIDEINQFMAKNDQDSHKLLDQEFAATVLSPWGLARFFSLPEFIRKQLILGREIHGGIQLSQIESERLIAHMVDEELKKRKQQGQYKGSFAPLCHFFGYQGRSATPSALDQKLGTFYGFNAGILIQSGLTGYSTTARGISGDMEKWHMGGIPLISFLELKGKSSYGQNQVVVPSHDVDLSSRAFLSLYKNRQDWQLVDYYTNSGPTQLFGEKKDEITDTLKQNHKLYQTQLTQVQNLTRDIEQSARFGVHQDLLEMIINSLQSVKSNIELIENKFI